MVADTVGAQGGGAVELGRAKWAAVAWATVVEQSS